MTVLAVEWLVPCLLLVLLVTCSFDDERPHCEHASECASGEDCYRGFCVSGDAGARSSARSPSMRSAAEIDDASEPASGADAGPAPAACREAVPCYEGPAATRGVGACRAGTRACVAGKLGACSGSRLPAPETCANEGRDDDCNGVMDDIPRRGEACESAASSPQCARGSLRCLAEQAALRCVATPIDEPESCNGRDDDCDGKSDEGVNVETDAAHCGSCEHRCAPGQSCRARVCVAADGCGSGAACGRGTSCCGGACAHLQTDPQHCGACGHACQADESCCGGACVDTRSDPAHCGRCGAACTGELPGCCGGVCKDLASDNHHCGRCGAECGGVLGGLLCACRQEAGKVHCEGAVLDLCL